MASGRSTPGGLALAWNSKYWDIVSNLYWTPRYLGLQSIGRDKWRVDGDWVSVPKNLVTNTSVRSRCDRTSSMSSKLISTVRRRFSTTVQPPVLDRGRRGHIALIVQPAWFGRRRPIRKPGTRDWVTVRLAGQRKCHPTGWAVRQSILGCRGRTQVRLRLSWPEQIAKYVALMVWEEAFSHQRERLGLLFIVQKVPCPRTGLMQVSKGRPLTKASRAADPARLPKKIQALFRTRPDQVRYVLQRLRLAVISWTQFFAELSEIEKGLDPKQPGDQTLQRLLAGFRDQLERHQKTGLGTAAAKGELVTVMAGKPVRCTPAQ